MEKKEQRKKYIKKYKISRFTNYQLMVGIFMTEYLIMPVNLPGSRISPAVLKLGYFYEMS